LTDAYPPHHFGGYELTCADVMSRFQAAGHEVQVLTSTVQVPGVAMTAEPGVSRELIPYWDWNANVADVPRSPLARLRIERHNLGVLRRELTRLKPNVVSAWNMCGLSLSMLTECERRGLPIVITVENEWLRIAPEQDGWGRMWQRRNIRWPATVLGVPTQGPSYDTTWADFASDFMRRVTPPELVPHFRTEQVIHLGIDLTDFPLTEPTQREWGWRLLYVGRLDEAKGLETLFRAFATLPDDAQLRVIGGSGEGYQQRLLELATSLGVLERISFDRLPRDQLRAEYLAADALVFPSEWEEPFGLVPLEAMACGTPVVSTRQGGAAEFLAHDDNCLAFTPRDVAGLATAITRLAEDSTLRTRLVSGGLQTAQRLTIDRHAEAVMDLHARAAHNDSEDSR
jgi:glycosyltransferase involved in cell wall biosynthesis